MTDYQRMKVDQFGELRNRLAPAGAEVHVVKNSFLKRAMADPGCRMSADKLTGQTAIVTGEKDVAPVAKILKTVRGGIQDRGAEDRRGRQGGFVDGRVEALADLPSREVLLAQLARVAPRAGDADWSAF